MPRTLVRIACTVASAVLVASSLNAQSVVYDNGVGSGSNGKGMYSSSGNSSASNFTLGNDATITGINFGAYQTAGRNVYKNGGTGSFFWTFFADNGGAPGAVVATGTGDATKNGSTYSFDIDPTNLTGNTRYWVSITQTPKPGEATLYWQTTSANTSKAGDAYGSQDNWTKTSDHLAFSLTGSVTTTPEPATLALLGTGLVGLVPMVRRRKKND